MSRSEVRGVASGGQAGDDGEKRLWRLRECCF